MGNMYAACHSVLIDLAKLRGDGQKKGPSLRATSAKPEGKKLSALSRFWVGALPPFPVASF
jgi:hypothetical protein